MICKQCKKEIEIKGTHCEHCGAYLTHMSTKAKRCIVAVVLLMCLLVAPAYIIFNKYQNTFDADITRSDFTVSETISGDVVTITITPKMDMKNLRMTVVFYRNTSGQSYADSHRVAEVAKGEKLVYTYSLNLIKSRLSGASYESMDVTEIQGKKRNKHKNN